MKRSRDGFTLIELLVVPIRGFRRISDSFGTRSRSSSKHQSAFTLIELLVVIAIIAILAAILFPVFAKARAKARQTSCVSNVKNLAMGILMYAQDYDEIYMRSNQDATAAECNAAPGGCWATGFVFWQQMSQSYFKNLQIMDCPDGNRNSVNTPYYGHFGASRDILKRRQAVDPRSIPVSLVNSPGNTFMIFDCGTYSLDPLQDTVAASPNGTRGNFWYIPGLGDAVNLTANAPAILPELIPDFKSGRHFGGINVAFCDGHVKYVRTEEAWNQAKKYQAGQPNAWDPKNPN